MSNTTTNNFKNFSSVTNMAI